MTSMKNVIVLLADGFEEMEAVLPIDLLRRAGLTVHSISMNKSLTVLGSRNITVKADKLVSELEEDFAKNNVPDAVFLPGGLQGSINLSKHPFTEKLLHTMLENNKIVTVICAAPIIVLAPLGLLDGKNFTCYPGMEKETQYTEKADIAGYKTDRVVVDSNIITSQGPGTAAECAFALIEALLDKGTSQKVQSDALFL